ncbi:hypothetical protein DFJ58DRAFT_64525 [Suillus subalutaceus]|uniref:uncharacterized protein n=1 Tax=Suillus subalutaceus TaxID=48586 RepID=UPI001B874DD4|nr:uncharacterized protein DFJ58DRAFT_64525 [Suillus subalutaceus]KAG1869440.1 hypothetical protein DFJ58DRAFT_64525 [Suillus subalutaceus]
MRSRSEFSIRTLTERLLFLVLRLLDVTAHTRWHLGPGEIDAVLWTPAAPVTWHGSAINIASRLAVPILYMNDIGPFLTLPRSQVDKRKRKLSRNSSQDTEATAPESSHRPHGRVVENTRELVHETSYAFKVTEGGVKRLRISDLALEGFPQPQPCSPA